MVERIQRLRSLELRCPDAAARCAVALVYVCLGVALAVTLVGCDANESRSLTVMNEGVANYKENNYGGAISKLKESVSLWPENADAHYMLGQIYLSKFQDPQQAITHLEAAAKHKPEKAGHWYQKGNCLTELKRLPEAEAALLKATEMDPKHGDAFYRLARISESQGQLVKAAERYGMSVNANPRKPFAYYNLGDLYFRNEKYKEAEVVFKNAVENNPNNAELHHGLGLTYLTGGRHQEALIEFQEALRLKPTYPSATYNLGMTYVALKDSVRAKGYLEAFLKQAPAGDNAARIVAAETRLIEINEAERQAGGKP